MDTAERESLLAELRAIPGDISLLVDAPMSHYTTLRLGGPADVLCGVTAPGQLPLVLAAAGRQGQPVTLMGNGSNLLVRDGGIRGLVVRMAEGFAEVSGPTPLPDGRLSLMAQAGASLAKLANTAARHGLGGLAFAAGIPGTVGGAAYMNAGAYGGEMKDVVWQVEGYGPDGTPFALDGRAMAFGYRTSALSKGPPRAVEMVTVALHRADPQAIRADMRTFAAKRREKQPVGLPSCGSTFKRPAEGYAAALIDQCGLKGYRVGGASVSTLHGGFLVNDGGGTAQDYLALMEAVRQTVHSQTGIWLEPEVRILGEDTPAG